MTQKIVFPIFIILFSFFISCQDKMKKKTKILLKKTLEVDSKLETEVQNTTIYPVYNLTSHTNAIVITLFESEKNSKFQEIFEKINEKDSLEAAFYDPSFVKFKKLKYYDTLGIIKLIKSEKLKNEIRKISEPKYYVYGTKGFSEMKIDDVICRIDDCRETFIGLTIKDFDTIRNGRPILCSKKLLKLNYNKDYSKIEQKIQKMDDSIVYRYNDRIKTKVYANIGSLYFVYNDDFLWGKNQKKSKCQFPERRILSLQKNNSFKTLYVEGLDLYGARCD